MRKTSFEHTSPSSRGVAFSQYLSSLLDDRDTSVRDLAEALDIDVSLVYKWLRGERTPALDAKYLSELDRILDLDPAERSALRAAQAFSLKQGRPKKPVSRRVARLVARIVNRQPGVEEEADADAGERAPGCEPVCAPVCVPACELPKDGALCDPLAMQEATIALIAGASKPEGDANTIQITFQSTGDAIFDPKFAARAQQALRQALADGWHVEHVVRLDRDLRRTVPLVENMLDLLGAGPGHYSPHRLKTYEPLSPPYELLLRPDAALLLLATDNPHTANAGILTRDPDQITLLRAHFAQMLKQTEPLLRSFRERERDAFFDVLTDAEVTLPGRCFVKYGLSLYTEPADWSHPDSHCALMMARDGYDVGRFIDCRDRRLAAFAENVRKALYRDICPKEAIEAMVRDGAYMGTGKRAQRIKVPESERKKHIENLVRVLREHENFQLALTERGQADVRIPEATFWEVVGGRQVLVNTRGRDADGRAIPLEIAIDEPTLAAAFQYYFDSLWERISPRNRDKDYVIWWLERQRDTRRA